ncbi:ATP/GTP-binding protein [Clavibacter tessellarius]|uniref:ATP/GTP-binding protein n=1 Tax=Clavibacter tessellarius TaxID=31965 RepID=UPI0039ECFAB3
MTDTREGTGRGKRAAVNLPWYASVPGLRIFVSPELLREQPPAGDIGAASMGPQGIDAPPFELPGGQLRAVPRAAERGWYAPRLSGAPSTTKQAEILNTAIIGNPTGHEGIVNGRDNLSQSMISYDAPTAYNTQPRQISSPNVIVLGTVGYGKSSKTKTTGVARPLTLRNRRAVVFDKKDEGGVGEYYAMAQRHGTESLRFDPSGDGVRLNLLDPLIMHGSGLQGQMELINAIARIARNDVAATEWEEKATRFALREMYRQHSNSERTFTTTDLMPYLGRVPTGEGLTPSSGERFHQAGLSIRFGLENLLETYSGMFDGDTSGIVDLAGKLTVFDVSQLPDAGPAIPTVMAVGHQWLLGRLRRERGFITNVIYEEGWHMIGGPSARLVKSNQKLSRALGISNWFVMHKGTDIPRDSEGYTVIQEAQTIYAFRQDRPDDARWVAETFGFAPDTAESLMNLRPGHCIFKYGSNPETHLEHIRSSWEVAVTNTDAAMSGASRLPVDIEA